MTAWWWLAAAGCGATPARVGDPAEKVAADTAVAAPTGLAVTTGLPLLWIDPETGRVWDVDAETGLVESSA